MKTPELEKIATNADESQKIGQFLSWLLDEQQISLCEYDESATERCWEDGMDDDFEIYAPVGMKIEQLLAQYFGVDLAKAEKERQGLLAEIQANS